eukprot:TRINITY_DN2869_c1_g1_i1.p1 TRINITY_DN2869_c1_g1~~TRINITY_DN2869_c1_g1_i1.p1  ORF type:complete len:113 (+),score=46.81 TRINITY_DN2869_c1_g1_i1:43-339(+)
MGCCGSSPAKPDDKATKTQKPGKAPEKESPKQEKVVAPVAEEKVKVEEKKVEEVKKEPEAVRAEPAGGETEDKKVLPADDFASQYDQIMNNFERQQSD